MTVSIGASRFQALISRSLYRSLLRASKPFTLSPNAAVLTCLLHRLGEDDEYSSFLRNDEVTHVVTPTVQPSGSVPKVTSGALFNFLLDEVISGHSLGLRQMSFPSQVDTSRLMSVIRREFRAGPDSLSSSVDVPSRRQAAFSALRELNKKLAWFEKLASQAALRTPHPQQAARGVRPLPCHPPKAYLRPGCFLIAHPHLSGFFRRSVIILLDHNEVQDDTASSGYGSYGLIINRLAHSPSAPNKGLQLREVLQPLPSAIEKAFSSCCVREGGPVHMSLQILTAATSEQHDECQLGGQLLSSLTESGLGDRAGSTKGDKAIFYGGDLVEIASATLQGKLDRHDTVFFVGASSWGVGQLESEVDRGCWLPCQGPIDIAYTGACEHEEALSSAVLSKRPKADLWLSMMSACGPKEAAFAHLMLDDEGDDELGAPCDEDTSGA